MFLWNDDVRCLPIIVHDIIGNCYTSTINQRCNFKMVHYCYTYMLKFTSWISVTSVSRFLFLFFLHMSDISCLNVSLFPWSILHNNRIFDEMCLLHMMSSIVLLLGLDFYHSLSFSLHTIIMERITITSDQMTMVFFGFDVYRGNSCTQRSDSKQNPCNWQDGSCLLGVTWREWKCTTIKRSHTIGRIANGSSVGRSRFTTKW